MVFSVKGEERAKRILMGAYNNNRIPNAYIFSGRNIAEMSCIAKEFAKLLICRSVPDCPDDKNIEKEIHPDFFTICPDGKFIKIDQMKRIRDLVKYGPSSGSYLVVRIIGAHLMNTESANSFLKTLEEPVDKVLFILITDKEDAVLKTIISRCQKIIFSNMPEDDPVEVDPVNACDISSILQYSRNLAESPDLEKKLYKLAVYYLNNKQIDNRSAKAYAALDAAKAIKRNANVKLAVDVMCLKGA